MEIIYGTGNIEKLKQVQEFLDITGKSVKLKSLKDIGFKENIEETGTTFEENSYIKASAIKNYCNKSNIKGIIITDDTGLCVDSLNGAPGIYSARYAGDHAPQEIAINKLLNEMKDVPEEKRTARFICVLTAILENGEKITVEGKTEGKIAEKPSVMGKLTFGPVFIPEGFNKTMNELTPEELGNTHREKALLEMLNILDKKFKNIE